MDKTDVLDRLTYCGECGYWNPSNDKRFKEEYHDYVGHCNKPGEPMVMRCKDDFCSCGVKRRGCNDSLR